MAAPATTSVLGAHDERAGRGLQHEVAEGHPAGQVLERHPEAASSDEVRVAGEEIRLDRGREDQGAAQEVLGEQPGVDGRGRHAGLGEHPARPGHGLPPGRDATAGGGARTGGRRGDRPAVAGNGGHPRPAAAAASRAASSISTAEAMTGPRSPSSTWSRL